MNWLAHLVLSEPSPAFRIGNLLPDILPWEEVRALPAKFQGGIACHRDIDSFTDAHPIFRRSMGRIDAPYRRYAGILIDIFYDHFLSSSWSRYSAVSLDQFVAEFHASISAYRDELPPRAYLRLVQIKDGNWLNAYRELNGVRRSLEGIGKRFRKPVSLGGATEQLKLHFDALRDDFADFFPELSLYVAGRGGPPLQQ